MLNTLKSKTIDMKKLIMVIVITQMVLSCCTSSKKTTEVAAVTNEEQAATDTILTADTIVADTLVEVLDTIVEQEPVVEELKVPATFIDSITFQYDSLIGDCQQLLVVYNTQAASIVSELKVYEKGDEGWTAVDSLCGPCNIGRKGFAAYGKKAEGDGKSPTGIFTITHYFSRFPSFTAKLEKIKVTQNTVWVDDPKDKLYNTYCEQSTTHPHKGERLIRKDGQYDYVMVINYNTEERKPYKGSAIFFHVWTRLGGGTAGCVAVEKQHIRKIFNWIDAEKHPKIVMGSLENEGIFTIGD